MFTFLKQWMFVARFRTIAESFKSAMRMRRERHKAEHFHKIPQFHDPDLDWQIICGAVEEPASADKKSPKQ